MVIPISLSVAKAFLIKETGSILVDTGTPDNEDKILKKLNEKGIAPKTIRLIIITHGHYDHLGSAFALREITGAPIVMHKSDAESARTGDSQKLKGRGWLGKLAAPLMNFNKTEKPRFTPFEPDIVIEGEMNLESYGISGKILPTPGHTPGSISIGLASGEVIIGDLLMGGFLFPKRPNFPFILNNMEQVKASIKSILRLNPKIICCTHGGPFEPKDVVERFS